MCCTGDNSDGAGGVVAAGLVPHAAHARGEAPRPAALAGRRPRAPHALRPPRASLRALGLCVRAPGGLRPPHHLRQDHAPHPARRRGALRARLPAGQVPRAPLLAAAHAASALARAPSASARAPSALAAHVTLPARAHAEPGRAGAVTRAPHRATRHRNGNVKLGIVTENFDEVLDD